jgi:hypothetical protein
MDEKIHTTIIISLGIMGKKTSSIIFVTEGTYNFFFAYQIDIIKNAEKRVELPCKQRLEE